MLGLCFGGQALAAALGAAVETAPQPELGWTTIETDDPERIPAGPWLEWHFDRFAVPPGATEVARTGAAPQAFRHGRHLGVQFHPESTVEIVARWATSDAERLAALGLDGDALIAATEDERAAARDAAFAFFDGFLETASEPAASAAAVREAMMGHPPELSDASVTSVRVIYPDLHGVARGKDVPLIEFDRVTDHGLAFCAAVMATDLRHTPVLGPRDRLSRPRRQARPRHADAAAVGARRRLLHRRRRAGRRGLRASRPTRAAPSGARSPATRSWASRRSSGRSSSSSSASRTRPRPAGCGATSTT